MKKLLMIVVVCFSVNAHAVSQAQRDAAVDQSFVELNTFCQDKTKDMDPRTFENTKELYTEFSNSYGREVADWMGKSVLVTQCKNDQIRLLLKALMNANLAK